MDRPKPVSVSFDAPEVLHGYVVIPAIISSSLVSDAFSSSGVMSAACGPNYSAASSIVNPSRCWPFLVAIRWPSIQPVCAVFDIYSRNYSFCFGD
jgi:hypothetical protein